MKLNKYHDSLVHGKAYLKPTTKVSVIVEGITTTMFIPSKLTQAVESEVNMGKDLIKPKDSKKRKAIVLAAMQQVERKVIDPITNDLLKHIKNAKKAYFKNKRRNQLINNIL